MISTALFCGMLLWVLPPAAAEGEGLKVTVREVFDVRHVRVGAKGGSTEARFSAERPGLRLVVEVQGADAARASHYGMLALEAATDDQGGKLKLDKSALGFNDMRKEFIPIDREQMFFGQDEPPADVIRVELPFESPARAATAVTVRAKLQLKKVETMDLLVATTPGAVQDEQVTKLGLKIKIVKPQQEGAAFAYELSGKPDALHTAELVDAQGKALETTGRSTMGIGETRRCEFTLKEPLPAGAKLKLALVVKAENVPVEFELKDVKLP